jgi:hypothetical protein
MCRKPILGGLITIFGVTLFIIVVLLLHLVQGGYDPVNQLMSELVFGVYGDIMILAFLGLAISSSGVQIMLINQDANFFLHSLLAGVTFCFVGSGIFTLGNAATIHIILITLAFMLAGLTMYLFPDLAGSASNYVSRYVSWGFAVAMACSVLLGHFLLPIGIGQRLAAIFLLAWFTTLGWCFIRNYTHARNEPE